MWVGEKFYRTTFNFMDEAASMGISRKVNGIPKGFEIGKHGIFLVHRNAILQSNADPKPGVFSWFMPTHVDLVVEWDTGEMLKAGTPLLGTPSARAKRLKDSLGDDARIVVVEKIEKEKTGAGQLSTV
jgi:hypothetical protein